MCILYTTMFHRQKLACAVSQHLSAVQCCLKLRHLFEVVQYTYVSNHSFTSNDSVDSYRFQAAPFDLMHNCIAFSGMKVNVLVTHQNNLLQKRQNTRHEWLQDSLLDSLKESYFS